MRRPSLDTLIAEAKKRDRKKRPLMIDKRTTIMVDPGDSDEEARERYLNKLKDRK